MAETRFFGEYRGLNEERCSPLYVVRYSSGSRLATTLLIVGVDHFDDRVEEVTSTSARHHDAIFFNIVKFYVLRDSN